MAKLNSGDEETLGGAIAPITPEKRKEKQLATKARQAEMAMQSSEWTLDTLRLELDASEVNRYSVIGKYKKYRPELLREFCNSTDLMNSNEGVLPSGNNDMY